MLLPPALGSSPYPPVSVCGTGTMGAIAAFLGSWPGSFPTYFRSASRLQYRCTDFPAHHLYRLHRYSRPRLSRSFCVPTVLSHCSTGISTCCPSATPPGLALGPDSPREDELYPGNLGYPAVRILTLLSLLIPAFSLPVGPLLLPVQLLPPGMLLYRWLSPSLGFGGVFQPRTFSAQGLSASELLRTLSMHGCF